MGMQAEKYQSPTGMEQRNSHHGTHNQRGQNKRKGGQNQRWQNRRGGIQRHGQEIQTTHCEISKILFRCNLNAGGYIPKNR